MFDGDGDLVQHRAGAVEIQRIVNLVDDEAATAEEVAADEPAGHLTCDALHEEPGLALDRIVPHLRRLEFHEFDALAIDPLDFRVLPELERGACGACPGAATVHPPAAVVGLLAVDRLGALDFSEDRVLIERLDIGEQRLLGVDERLRFFHGTASCERNAHRSRTVLVRKRLGLDVRPHRLVPLVLGMRVVLALQQHVLVLLAELLRQPHTVHVDVLQQRLHQVLILGERGERHHFQRGVVGLDHSTSGLTLLDQGHALVVHVLRDDAARQGVRKPAGILEA